MKKQKIYITGATGFVGKNLMLRLIASNYDVTALVRDDSKLIGIKHLNFDINDSATWNFEPEPNVTLIHCAWENVRDLESISHIKNYQKHYSFIESMVNKGVVNIMIMGSVSEYGLQYGPISAHDETRPNTPYAFAKDCLHKSLRYLQKEKEFNLIWARLFYLFGNGQNAKSIIPLLDKAIDNNEEFFNMSFGEQLLDYLPIEEATKKIIDLMAKGNGVFNVCSGKPISIRRLVEQRMIEKGKHINLNLGFHKYRDQDAFAIWGA
jgi:nucleoside-diphosphate-sugar epimerase